MIKRMNHNFFEVMKSEHAELVGLLSQIRHMLRMRQGEPAEVDRMVVDLCNLVEGHFLHEEAGGYLKEAIQKAPNLAQRASRLFEQHEQLLIEVRELRDKVEDGLSTSVNWDELERAFESFALSLMTHEAHEDDLVQEAAARDEP